MTSASDMMFKLLSGLSKLDSLPTDTIETALARAPKDNEVHRLAATAWRCSKCGGTGFLSQLILLIDCGTVECPHCEGEDTAVVIEDARATA